MRHICCGNWRNEPASQGGEGFFFGLKLSVARRILLFPRAAVLSHIGSEPDMAIPARFHMYASAASRMDVADGHDGWQPNRPLPFRPSVALHLRLTPFRGTPCSQGRSLCGREDVLAETPHRDCESFFLHPFRQSHWELLLRNLVCFQNSELSGPFLSGNLAALRSGRQRTTYDGIR